MLMGRVLDESWLVAAVGLREFGFTLTQALICVFCSCTPFQSTS